MDFLSKNLIIKSTLFRKARDRSPRLDLQLVWKRFVFSDRRRSYFQSCCFAGLTQSQLNQLFLAAVAGVWPGSAHHLSHSSVERGTLIIVTKNFIPDFQHGFERKGKNTSRGDRRFHGTTGHPTAAAQCPGRH
jgi:hypothetical protein